MELNQLETFLAVAEERSFSRAAVRLHRTQPAVSQVIRKLEEDSRRNSLRPRRARRIAHRRRSAVARLRAAPARPAPRGRQRPGRVEEPGARPAAIGRQRIHLHVPAAGHRRLPPPGSARERDRASHAGLAHSRGARICAPSSWASSPSVPILSSSAPSPSMETAWT